MNKKRWRIYDNRSLKTSIRICHPDPINCWPGLFIQASYLSLITVTNEMKCQKTKTISLLCPFRCLSPPSFGLVTLSLLQIVLLLLTTFPTQWTTPAVDGWVGPEAVIAGMEGKWRSFCTFIYYKTARKIQEICTASPSSQCHCDIMTFHDQFNTRLAERNAAKGEGEFYHRQPQELERVDGLIVTTGVSLSFPLAQTKWINDCL